MDRFMYEIEQHLHAFTVSNLTLTQHTQHNTTLTQTMPLYSNTNYHTFSIAIERTHIIRQVDICTHAWSFAHSHIERRAHSPIIRT